MKIDYISFLGAISVNWYYLQVDWIQNDDLQIVVSHAKRSFPKPFFMERYAKKKKIRHEQPSFCRWKYGFTHDMSLLRHILKANHLVGFLAWLDFLP